MRKALTFVAVIMLLAAAVPAPAAFTTLYCFGDGISTTTNNPSTGPLYYGKRYSNGRVWVEVLAQRQGLTYDPNKNWSYFFNSSTTMLASVTGFHAPPDASNDLFVIWVNCADLWFPAYYSGTSLSQWTNDINQSQINYFKAATNLCGKGVRTLIMPNVVDLSTIPFFNTSVNAAFIHQQCLNYNIAFSNTVNQIRAACPNLTLYTPDFFALLTNLLTHPASYGVTNVLVQGLSMDAVNAQNYGYPPAATNGYGTNYIFWDQTDPTAKVHEIMADTVQQMISPPQFNQITVLTGSNRLDLANLPVGLNGSVLICTNFEPNNWVYALSDWMTNASFAAASPNQSVFVLTSVGGDKPNIIKGSSNPAIIANDTGPFPTNTVLPNMTLQLYRLSFPFAWSWP